MKLQIEASAAYFYPDVFVACGEEQRAKQTAKADALLIIEVLSPSNEAFDRGAKFAHYRHLPSLQEYVLVDMVRRSVDVYRRGGDSLWVLHPDVLEGSVELLSIGLLLPLAVIFEDSE